MLKNLCLVCVITLLISACKGNELVPVKQVVRPVKTMIIGLADVDGIRSFPGVVDASQKADISFRVSGKVRKLLVKEGDEVIKGQVLAELDPADYKIIVNDKQAGFNRAKADYNRAKKLVVKGHISRMDYDRLEADFKSKRAELATAKKDLSYTVLKAPFTGEIAKRYVDNFEEVLAKINIFTLTDNSTLEVKLNVPENIMLRVRSDRVEKNRGKIPVWASFESLPDKKFPLTFKEAARKADAKTQTFEVKYTMASPQGVNVLPGMTATVTADLSRHMTNTPEQIHYLPISAVTGDARLESRIWLVDEKTMTVHAKAVKLGTLTGNQVVVLEGIEGGERIVIAGAGYMAENMKVRLMEQPEQAQPRPEDVKLSTGLKS
jgi:RND family efflux transporter MFP subunit